MGDNMKERDFQSEFGKRNKVAGVFELKFCKGTSLPFKSVADHQIKALKDASTDGLYHKISDSPFFKDPAGKMRFTKPKPFDCFYLKNIHAYVVIMWWIPRKKKNVYYIPIARWVGMQSGFNRKSVTETMAEQYSAFTSSYLK